MYNSNKPSPSDLPSTGRLLRSTAVAMVAAAAILVTVVLPAEYGIDPTGAGRILGLTEMGEIKVQLAAEAEADRAEANAETARTDAAPLPTPQAMPETPTAVEPNPDNPEPAVDRLATAPATEPAPWRDEISITLAPGQGTEVKLVMRAGAKARFEWTANGGLLNYDTHGDGGGNKISYEKGRGVPGDEGELEAAFDGNHGWFWRNRTDRDVTMTLRTEGAYLEMKRVL
ncbi:transmembrane anchor protein [Pelagibius sp.]|uniref:transmembrane anchor protein n=1 Tax=Pelagibius sp. TaxID=1931238 RepID=UPI002638FCF5|nr:transmembrane anchor protein [Pelagibius sp.]